MATLVTPDAEPTEESNLQPQEPVSPVTVVDLDAVTGAPLQDTSAPVPTHVNAFKQDVLDALADAHKALGEAEEKVKALYNKLDVSV